MAKLENAIVKILYHVCALLMMVMATVVTAQVVSRYVFGNPFTWTEELARYVFVWMSMLGMAVGVKYGSHIALDILVKKLQGTPRKVLVAVNQLFILAFTVTLTYSGFKLVQLGTRQTSPSLGLPMEWVYIVIPVSGLLMMFFVLNETARLFKRERSGD
mgnify:FL=1|jgi:TRAP-type C4-dicarboxylate transport system permease small subunit